MEKLQLIGVGMLAFSMICFLLTTFNEILVFPAIMFFLFGILTTILGDM